MTLCVCVVCASAARLLVFVNPKLNPAQTDTPHQETLCAFCPLETFAELTESPAHWATGGGSIISGTARTVTPYLCLCYVFLVELPKAKLPLEVVFYLLLLSCDFSKKLFSSPSAAPTGRSPARLLAGGSSSHLHCLLCWHKNTELQSYDIISIFHPHKSADWPWC